LFLESLNRLKSNLANLGLKRLLALGLVGVLVFTLISASAFYMSKPTHEVLYGGLASQDISEIGAVLGEFGVSFDVSSDGKSVLVDYGQTAKARMLLAERGLPKGDKSGYELFDNLGSMGLTSFMQEVTKVRALEGELARTIQQMNGIRAARVHLVIPQSSTFRSIKEQPSASVMIRTEMNDGKAYAPAIQQLVAAAIPGLTKDMVTVLGTDGTILASHGDPLLDGPETMVSLEKSLAKDIQERVSRTLAPYLGVENFRVSVAAKLNTDRTQTQETKFDPESRVERSVRTIKDVAESQNKNSQSNTSVDQNIPTEKAPTAGGGQLSSEKNDKKEEQTNYEINSKSVATVSEGYKIEKLSIAILVNHSQLAKAMGGSPTQDLIDKQMVNLRSIVASAGGIDETRGDKIEMTSVDFMVQDSEIEPVSGDSIGSILTHNLSTFVNAIVLIVAILLVLLLGLKPALKSILQIPTERQNTDPSLALPMMNAIGSADTFPALGSGMGEMQGVTGNLIPDFSHELDKNGMARQKLEELVANDSEKVAKILKKWLAEPKASAA
jgi:flagellar M-ring protein FliF